MSKRPNENILPLLSTSKSIELFKKQISQIDHLLTLQYNDPEVDKWENFSQELIIKAFGKPSGNLDAFHSARWGGPVIIGMSDEAFQKNFINSRHALKKLFEGFIEQLEFFAEDNQSNISTEKKESTKLSNEIFIVHGHDDKAKSELSNFLLKLGFKPIILHEQANQGFTIIEKLEKQSDVGFAFILLTPDDVGSKKGSTQKPRARQNVVFEFGLFAGRLGRSRVCCLHTGNVELPSDVHGLLYLPFSNSINECQIEIIRELRAAGYNVQI